MSERRTLRFDPYVARAIAAMKNAPAQKWTVRALAREAGLSRAPFARRFRTATGTSPLRWLTEHRLRIARRRLVESDDALAVIARDVGYGSEFALSKAFKRLMGIAPAIFRRRATVLAHARATFRAAA
jgi:transcriptional regulator GlxA family with amidase domain